MAANKCLYCHGQGLDAGLWDKGYRRPVPTGARGNIHPQWASIRRYACDRCGKPSGLPPADAVKR